MKKLIVLSVFLLWPLRPAAAEDAYFKVGPFELTVPFKTADVVYLFNGLGDKVAERSLIGAETTLLRAWDKISGTAGVVTSAAGNGAPFIGADISVGNVLDRFVNLGDLRIGGFASYDFRLEEPMAGLKASIKIW